MISVSISSAFILNGTQKDDTDINTETIIH